MPKLKRRREISIKNKKVSHQVVSPSSDHGDVGSEANTVVIPMLHDPESDFASTEDVIGDNSMLEQLQAKQVSVLHAAVDSEILLSENIAEMFEICEDRSIDPIPPMCMQHSNVDILKIREQDVSNRTIDDMQNSDIDLLVPSLQEMNNIGVSPLLSNFVNEVLDHLVVDPKVCEDIQDEDKLVKNLSQHEDIANAVKETNTEGNAVHQRSYSNVVRGVKIKPLDFVIMSDSKQIVDGDPAFIITEDEWQQSVQTCKWQCILKFSMARPSLKFIKDQISSSWGLSITPSVGLLDNRHVMVSAFSDEDCNRILARDDYRMGRGVFRVFRWSESFNKQRESPIIQRWVRLPGLPSNCCSMAMLKGIGESISKFIAADNRTVSKEVPGYARICVEIDVSRELPTRVWIGTSASIGFWQKIIIEGRTDYCVECRLHGHSSLNCRHSMGGKQNITQKNDSREMVLGDKAVVISVLEGQNVQNIVESEVIQSNEVDCGYGVGSNHSTIQEMANPIQSEKEGVAVTNNNVQEISESCITLSVGSIVCQIQNLDEDLEKGKIIGNKNEKMTLQDESTVTDREAVLGKVTDKYNIERTVENQNVGDSDEENVQSTVTDQNVLKEKESLVDSDKQQSGSKDLTPELLGGQIDWVKEVGFEVDWDSPLRFDSDLPLARRSKRNVR